MTARILQVFINSVMSIAWATLMIDYFTDGSWHLRRGDLTFLLLSWGLLSILIGTVVLNLRVLRSYRYTLSPPTRMVPQFISLGLSSGLLYLMAARRISVEAHHDPHLSSYELTFKLPERPISYGDWCNGDISIYGFGGQIGIFLFYLLMINLSLVIANVNASATVSSVSNRTFRTLALFQFALGALMGALAIAGIVGQFKQAGYLIESAESDPGLRNMGNVTTLVFRVFNYVALALYAQWIIRDGFQLRRIARKHELSIVTQ